jgi:hypothetical protein
MRANRIYEPVEAELRAALDKVARRCLRLEHRAREWLECLRASDLMMFETDREGWLAAHAAASCDATAEMLLPGDDNANSEHQQALEAMLEQKQEREAEQGEVG